MTYLPGFCLVFSFYFMVSVSVWVSYVIMILTTWNFPGSNFAAKTITMWNSRRCHLYAVQIISISNINSNWIKDQLFILIFKFIHKKSVGQYQIIQDNSIIRDRLTVLLVLPCNFWSLNVFGEAKFKGQGQDIFKELFFF